MSGGVSSSDNVITWVIGSVVARANLPVRSTRVGSFAGASPTCHVSPLTSTGFIL